MKFEKFVELKESAIILSELENPTLADYKSYIKLAEEIKEEMMAFESELGLNESLDYVYLNEDVVINEDEDLNEGLKDKLRNATNPVAKAWRWMDTLSKKFALDKFYKKMAVENQKIATNEIKLEIKKDQMSGISGPEATAKRKELDSMLEKIKLQRDKLAEIKKQYIEDTKDPNAILYPFGVNTEVIDKYVAIKNAEEKLATTEFKIKSARNVLTDKEMKELKDSVKQLKARETKYAEELKNVEEGVKNSIEKDDYSDADNEIKSEKIALDKKIEEVEADIEEYRNKMADASDDSKKEDYAKNLAALEKNKANYQKDKKKLAIKAKKTVLGSTKAETDN